MADLKTIYTKSPGNYSSTNWRTVIADTTGTGNLVFADSPALTGTPTASEPSDASNTTDIATTNFVALKAAGITPTGTVDYVSLSGTTQLLNLNSGNFFDGGTLTGDTTLSFSNIPAGTSKWTYTFETGWDVTDVDNVIFSNAPFSVSGQETTPRGIFFKSDGTRMYVLGDIGDDVNQYNLSVPWDVTTGVTFDASFSVAGQETNPEAIFFKPDGTRMYSIGHVGDDVNQYNLSVPWDVTTGVTFDASYSVAGQDTFPQGFFFKPDGTRMYVLGDIGDDINQYNLSVPWDVTTGVTFDASFSVAGQDTLLEAIFFKPDGTRMYLIGGDGSDINQYNLSVPWDVTTGVTFDSNFSLAGQETDPEGIFFKPDGTRMYVIGDNSNSVNQYDLFPYTISLPEAVRNFEYDSIKPGRNTLDFYTTDGGTNIYVNHTVF